jgi:O-antigen ligase
MLVALSIVTLKSNFQLHQKDKYLYQLILTFLLASSLRIISDINDGQGISSFDTPVKLALCTFVLLFLHNHPIKSSYFFAGIGMGCLTAFIVAAQQLFWAGNGRAFAGQGIIQTGNASMVFGLIALCISMYYFQKRSYLAWGFLIAALLGCCGSLFSGSRGGWAFTPLVILFIFYQSKSLIPKRYLFITALILSVIAISAYITPATGISERINTAIKHTAAYINTPTETNYNSESIRLEMWKSGWNAFLEKPFFGWGKYGLHVFLDSYYKESNAPETITQAHHLHNDYINELATRGILGLAVYLAAIFIPLRYFYKQLRYGHKQQNSELILFSSCGVVFLISILGFSVTHSFFYHNSGFIFYGFLVSILYAYTHHSALAQGK